MSDRELYKENAHAEPNKFHEIEITKVFEAVNSIQNRRVQLGTFFGTANLAVLSIAFSTEKASFFFFAGALLWMFLTIDGILLSSFYAFCYRGLQLQAQFAPNDDDSFWNVLLLGGWEPKIRKIADLPERESRQRALHTLWIRDPSISGFWTPLAGSLIEIAAGVVFWLAFGWSLF